MIMPDPMKATIKLLAGDDDLRALVDVRVFGDKVPKDEAAAGVRKLVVVRHAPGMIAIGGYVDVIEENYDVLCYGETPSEAKAVFLEVYRILKRARRQVIKQVLIHSYEQIGSPRAFVDLDVQWDGIVCSWKSLASENQVIS